MPIASFFVFLLYIRATREFGPWSILRASKVFHPFDLSHSLTSLPSPVNISGRVYFAFSDWTKDSSGKIVSLCSSTKPGWVHSVALYNPSKFCLPASFACFSFLPYHGMCSWGCFIGKKNPSIADAAPHTQQLSVPSSVELARRNKRFLSLSSTFFCRF